MKIQFLVLNPNLTGPLPKHNPLLIKSFENKGNITIRSSWGRHSDNETIINKIVGRFFDLLIAIRNTVIFKPDIIYIGTTLNYHSLLRDIPLLLLLKVFPSKKIVKMHGSRSDYFAKPGRPIFKLSSKIIILLSDAIFLLSTDEINEWNKFYPSDKYYFVNNPYKFCNLEYSENKAEPPIIFYAGRLIKEKGIYDLLTAISIVLQKTDCQLVIAGIGEEEKEIANYINSNKLSNKIKMVGYLSGHALIDMYRKSSVFVLPTYFGEGYPTAITEAMNYKLPIITTKHRGIKDHLSEKNAIFISPKAPDQIAQAIIELLGDKNLMYEMGEENYKLVQKFSPDIVGDQYLEIFNEILSNLIRSKPILNNN
jgi:glycosyltransferase involved in cell wall biosynthesis